MAPPYEGWIRFPASRAGILRGANQLAFYGRSTTKHLRVAGPHEGDRVLDVQLHVGLQAVEDLQWIPPAGSALHKTIAAGAASTGRQPYLPLASLVISVENASKSRYGPLLGALAAFAWVCFLRVGEVASVRVADIELPGSIQFWNSKTGEEGYSTRPVSRYADQVREWAYIFSVASGKQTDILVSRAGEVGLESGMAECSVGTAYATARWHALRRGGAVACWARKPDTAYFKWWGRWQFLAVAIQYATHGLIQQSFPPPPSQPGIGPRDPARSPSN